MKHLLTAVVAAVALWAAACSSGGPTITPPPPTGNYSLVSLSGTYAFVTSGEAITSTSGTPIPLARTGSFIANGSGVIQGGVYDLVNGGGFSTTSSSPVPITGGSYTVNADGRGTLTLNVTSNGGPATINFAIVLTSTSDGLMIDETAGGTQASTGSGNFILQNKAAFGISNISGPYVFDFSGLDGTQPPSPESLVGQFNATNTGIITTGFEDGNDGGALNSASMAPGTLTADQANMATSGRGTAVIEGQSYAFYIVDSTRVRFISINSTGIGPMLTGDAVLQSNIPTSLSAINGGFAFLVGGSSANGGLTRVGRFTVTNGALSKILMDVNNAGNETQVPGLSSGNITAFDPMTGRSTLSFSNATTTYSFVFYLSSASSGVIQDVSAPTGSTTAVVVADGSILAQSGSPFTASNISGNYAMNWSGLETSGSGFQDEEDLVSQVKVSNLSLSGTSDIFQFTSATLTPQTDIGTAGTITFNGGDGTGDDGKRVDLNVNLSGASPIDMVVYIVNPQLAFFENRDNSGAQRIVAGILRAQQ
jgi:hypothetical protein